MANAMLGYANAVLSGAVSAGSEVGGLTAGNLQNPHGSDASAWRTAGALTPEAGAWVTINAGASATWRAFLLAGTNLTAAASIRWRVGGATGIFPEVPLFAADFTAAVPVMPAGTVFARATEGRYFGSDGALVAAPAATPRIAFDPTTLALQGLLVEPASTNSVRNPRAEFASPPTLPTTAAPINWAHAGSGGITSTIVAQGVEAGIPYVDVRFAGTSASGTGLVWFESATGIAAASGDLCAFSVFIREISRVGSISANTLFLSELNGAFAVVATQSGSIAAATSAGLATQRRSMSATLAGVGTASVRPSLAFNFANGATDITIRVGLPQVEKALAFATSPMLPPVGAPAAQARAADDLTWPLPATYTGGVGTMFAEQITGAVPPLSAIVAWFRMDDTGTANRAELRTGSNASAAAYVSANIVRSSSTQATGALTFASLGTLLRQSMAWGTNDFAAFYGGAAKGTDITVTPPPVTRLWVSAPNAVVYFRRLALYATRLTDGQTLRLSTDGATLDPAAVAYDSGTIPAGVVPGFGQSIHVAPSTVTGQYARCDLTDAANPDGFLSVALAYAGPVWQPAVNVSPDTALGATRGQDAVRSRAGATFLTPRFYERGWTISHDAVAGADLWSQLMPLDRAAAQGDNILFVPDPASPNANRETVFGILETTAAVGLRTPTGEFRSWRARIAERL